MYSVFKSLAFKFDPENAHLLTVKCLSLLPSVFSSYGALEDSTRFQVKTNIGPMAFPVGIAAGLDKNAELIDYFGRLGVGGLEVGTVTPRAQEGNPKPRLFRLPKDESLRNCMGFNGDGAKAVLSNIKIANKYPMKLGINFGKNKVTPNEDALDDYLVLFDEFKGVGDYYVINVSSPNTPGLRDLQDKGFLLELSSELKKRDVEKPIYLKISPDMNEFLIKEISEIVGDSIFAGIIATNTSHIPKLGAGGVSGRLIKDKSRETRNQVLSILNQSSDKDVIGVGGVDSIEDIWDFWYHGGKYMQVYTSFIYHGPKLFTSYASRFDSLMRYFGVSSVEELISVAHSEKIELPSIN